MEETFTLLPLHIDPSTKVISCTGDVPADLQEELDALNQTQRAMLQLDAAHPVPPPPVPINPKRSAAIQKMREQGNASLAKRHTGGGGGGGGRPPSEQQQNQNVHDAIRFYTFAVEMALGRPAWEPVGIVRDEVAALLSNRAQAHIALQAWPDGAADARASVEMKRGPGQGKAWWRRGRCLLEMGRVDEAEAWVAEALEVEAAAGSAGGGGGGGPAEGGADLKSLKADIDARRSRRREREKKVGGKP